MARNRQTTQTNPTQKPLIEISEDEQRRLIQESGILKKIPTRKPEESTDNDEALPLAEEIFSAVVLIMPFTFFLVMMDM